MAPLRSSRDDKRGEAVLLSPRGRLDGDSADTFHNWLFDALALAPERIIVDCGSLDTMSSRGLKALVLAERAAREKGCTIILARPDATIREILAISRCDNVLRIADTLEEAIAR
ncbi:STAS domain-containing protein [Qipengyuania nanhaisediminis]|uniref:STAS domain-containing protein n=1 Tax=Qipengyuania nanhaisediminis TaxID=604088 RepID=UPI0038B3B06F